MDSINVTVIRNKNKKTIETKPGENLLTILNAHDVYIPAACGGNGKCGKCGIRIIKTPTDITELDRKFFTDEQLLGGWRMACTAYPTCDCTLEILTSDEKEFAIVTEFKAADDDALASGNQNLSSAQIAIDIGTTTIALSLLNESGHTVDTYTTINHQRAYGADVISRITAANEGKLKELKQSITEDLKKGIQSLLTHADKPLSIVNAITIAGNTTMGHLLMGYSCENLGVYPFTPVDISTIKISANELFCSTDYNDNCIVTLLPGISTYVGADIVAGILHTKMDQSDKVNILIDLGTNGEMAMGNKDKIMVTSTAAGPAFEGGNILWGTGSIAGAICDVNLNEIDNPKVSTIADKPPIGICGTGVISATCELLNQELIDDTGLLDEDYFDDGYPIAQNPEGKKIVFTQKDVREIQLAKSAVRAGLETMMLRFGVGYDDIDTLYLAGGFGYHMDIAKSVAIGMLPEELENRIQAIGNSSLAGAIDYLLNEDVPMRAVDIIGKATEISLSTDKDFNKFYTEYMFFA